MEAQEIIRYISEAEKKTPVRVTIREQRELPFENCRIFGGTDRVIYGDWEDIRPVLEANSADVLDLVVESDRRNSAVPLLEIKEVNARIEPGAIIREKVEIGERAVIMMGAVINIGAVIGEGSMIDMNAVLGGRAMVGKNCHIGAGTVLAGVIEPPSATPVIVEDDVVIGANATVIEGVRIGKGAVIAAGTVVIADVPSNSVVAGIPGRVVKLRDRSTAEKTELVEALRTL